MAKRNRQKDKPGPEQDATQPGEARPDDATKPAIDTSAMLAAHDQFEASKSGEANPPPSEEASDEKSPPTPPPIDEPLSAVPLKVFAKIAGPKWDQMAGFLHQAKIEKMKPRTVPEWRAIYQAFLRKPVK